MKKVLIITVLLLTIFFIEAQTNILPKKNIAEVNQVQGVYLFIMSKPVREYTYLGSTKIKVVWTGDPVEMINVTLKKLKKDYPTADGIIFTTMQMNQGDVIKFKD
jgi:hypothetical protein